MCSDYYTYVKRADQLGGSPHCRCCYAIESESRHIESTAHILTKCVAYADIRARIFPELSGLCSRSGLDFQEYLNDDDKLCQFSLDPTSLDLPRRIGISDPNLDTYFRKSRDLCYSIHNLRMKILKKKKDDEQP